MYMIKHKHQGMRRESTISNQQFRHELSKHDNVKTLLTFRRKYILCENATQEVHSHLTRRSGKAYMSHKCNIACDTACGIESGPWPITHVRMVGAGAQEACLQLYGGLSFASNLDRYSDAFRQADAAPIPPVPATTRPAVDDPGARPSDGDDGLSSQDDEVAAAVSERAPGAAQQRLGRGGGRRGRRAGRGSRIQESPAPVAAPSAADAAAAAAAPTQAEQRVSAASTGVRLGLEQLDDIDLASELRRQALTLQSAPTQLRGVLRFALRTGLEQAVSGAGPDAAARGWKLFFLAPRMLLHREPGQSRIEPAEIERRADAFRRGEWPSLLRAACPSTPARPAQRSPAEDESDRRAARAAALVHLGELSAASRALTAEPLADSNEATLAELRDPSRRPQTPVVPLSPAVLNHVAEPCPMPDTLLLANLRSARRGSAAGPSGMTLGGRSPRHSVSIRYLPWDCLALPCAASSPPRSRPPGTAPGHPCPPPRHLPWPPFGPTC